MKAQTHGNAEKCSPPEAPRNMMPSPQPTRRLLTGEQRMQESRACRGNREKAPETSEQRESLRTATGGRRTNQMKEFKTLINEISINEISEVEEASVIIGHGGEKTVKIGKNSKTAFTFTRTPGDKGVIGIEYGDKGNVVFIFGNEKRQLIDLLQGK